MKRLRFLSLPVIAGLLACGSGAPTGSDGFTDATGVPAHVVYVTHAFAGGQQMVDSLVVDSAGGRWRLRQCGPVSATGAVCGIGDFRTDTGTVSPLLRAPLFERARRPDFRLLRRDYARTGNRPPDALMHRLDIVQNGRRQTVVWETGAAVPEAAESFVCLLQQARGALVLCRD